MTGPDEGAVAQELGRVIGGALGITATSGPGICLKSEAIGLAVMTELPVVVIDVQRGGPSTGLPTKTEQADLLQANLCYLLAWAELQQAIGHTPGF